MVTPKVLTVVLLTFGSAVVFKIQGKSFEKFEQWATQKTLLEDSVKLFNGPRGGYVVLLAECVLSVARFALNQPSLTQPSPNPAIPQPSFSSTQLLLNSANGVGPPFEWLFIDLPLRTFLLTVRIDSYVQARCLQHAEAAWLRVC